MAEFQYVASTGVILTDTADLKTTVETEWREALGDDLDTSANTPQGVMITAEVLARDGVMRNNAAVANQINPNIAGGVFLDAIWALTGGKRRLASPSIIETVALTGTPGAIIPAGSLASIGANGDLFESLTDVTLGVDGTGSCAFQALVDGPIGCPTHSLNTIVSGVLGWEAVDNTVPATVGQAKESDAAARARRRNTLALQATSIAEAMRSQLYATAGVVSAQVVENETGGAVVFDGVNLAAHSIYACVDGGADAAVAAALLAKKSLGCAWNGATVVDVLDPSSGKTYAVHFDRPTAVPIFMTVTIRAGASIANPAETIRQAILTYAAGGVASEAGFVVGGDVSPFELAGAINEQFPEIFVKDFQIGIAADAQAAANIHIAINKKATVVEGNIAVNIV